MVRGKAKADAQAKNQAKAERSKKAGTQLVHRIAKAICPICKASMANPNDLRSHFESKHPKSELPQDLR